MLARRGRHHSAKSLPFQTRDLQLWRKCRAWPSAWTKSRGRRVCGSQSARARSERRTLRHRNHRRRQQLHDADVTAAQLNASAIGGSVEECKPARRSIHWVCNHGNRCGIYGKHPVHVTTKGLRRPSYPPTRKHHIPWLKRDRDASHARNSSSLSAPST